MAAFKKSVFIFRRDLRLVDNVGLIKALEQSDEVIPCFIFDPAQVFSKNEYRSLNCIEFMINSLKELDHEFAKKESHLNLFFGNPVSVLQEIITSLNPQAVFVNFDYTPFSTQRDADLNSLCEKHSIRFIQLHDSLLHEPSKIKTNMDKPYTYVHALF